MARLALPRELQELKNTIKDNPQRYRNKVPKSKLPCGNPPKGMSEEAQECWFEISTKVIDGVLTFADTIMLELASDLLAEYRLVRSMSLAERAEFKIRFSSTDKTILIGLLARFGMSPSDRTKLDIAPPKDDEDDFR